MFVQNFRQESWRKGENRKIWRLRPAPNSLSAPSRNSRRKSTDSKVGEIFKTSQKSNFLQEIALFRCVYPFAHIDFSLFFLLLSVVKALQFVPSLSRKRLAQSCCPQAFCCNATRVFVRLASLRLSRLLFISNLPLTLRHLPFSHCLFGFLSVRGCLPLSRILCRKSVLKWESQIAENMFEKSERNCREYWRRCSKTAS